MLESNFRFSRQSPLRLVLLLTLAASGCSTEDDGAAVDNDGGRANFSDEPCRKERDRDADGIIDDITTYSYSQNERGDTIVEARSPDGSMSDHLLTKVFDSEGRLLSSESDSGADGTIENRTVNSYDEAGLQLSHERYQDSGVTPVDRTYTTYNEDGKVLTRSQRSYSEFDGFMSFNSTYSYDEAGQLLACNVTNAEGVVTSTTGYSYNESGWLSTETTTSPDGSLVSTWTYEHDDAGNLKTETHSDQEGATTESKSYDYDDANHLISMKRFTAEGILFEEETYNEGGNLLTWVVDHDGDGIADVSRLNSYDANGNLLSIEFNDDPERPGLDTHSYDEAGNLLIDESDIDGDGIVDNRTIYIYDCQ